MSKIGKQPVSIPESVTVSAQDDLVLVKGPKGEMTIPLKRLVNVQVVDNQVIVTRLNDSKPAKSLHGTIRNLIANAIIGVTQGYSKTLKLVGTGYRVAPKGNGITLSLGFSHPVDIDPINGINFQIEGQDTIVISGINKHLVGQVSASIRAKRPPEPYKGKGVRYQDEFVARKAGKTAKAGE